MTERTLCAVQMYTILYANHGLKFQRVCVIPRSPVQNPEPYLLTALGLTRPVTVDGALIKGI